MIALLLFALCPLPECEPIVQPATRAWDLARFPPAEVCEHNLALARAHVEWLEKRGAALAPLPDHYAWWTEAQDASDCWYYLRLAHTWPSCADCYLGILRERLGPEAYFAGRMPSPVPLRHFRRLP